MLLYATLDPASFPTPPRTMSLATGAPYRLARRLDIRLLADAIAVMSDPLPAAVGTGDYFATIILFNVSGSADEAGSSGSIDRSRKASGGSLGGVNHLILRGKETGLTTSLVRAGACNTNRCAAIFEP